MPNVDTIFSIIVYIIICIIINIKSIETMAFINDIIIYNNYYLYVIYNYYI